jgi:hypothetical protein
MIAHIRQPKKPQPPSAIARARQMVAKALLPDESTDVQQRFAVRKALLVGGLVLLAVAAGLAYYYFRR